MGFDIQEVKCKNCGANLKKYISVGLATCEYCGTNYEIKNNSSELFEKPSQSSSLKPATSFSIVPIDNYVLNIDPPLGIEGVKIISAAANQFKKSYVIKSTLNIHPQDIQGPWLYYSENFRVDDRDSLELRRGIEEYIEKENKNRKKKINYDFLNSFQKKKIKTDAINEKEKEINSILELEKDYVTKEIEEYKRCGFKIIERIKKVPGRSIFHALNYSGNNTSSCPNNLHENEIHYPATWEVHSFNVEYPIITPEYCSTFFPDILKNYEKYKDKEFLLRFVKKVVKNIEENMEVALDKGRFALEVKNNGIWWFMSGKSEPLENVIFNQEGMENINTEEVLVAVTIVVVLHIMELTKQNGKLLLDFSENYPVWYNHKLERNIKFTWQERGIKKTDYNKW